MPKKRGLAALQNQQVIEGTYYTKNQSAMVKSAIYRPDYDFNGDSWRKQEEQPIHPDTHDYASRPQRELIMNENPHAQSMGMSA